MRDIKLLLIFLALVDVEQDIYWFCLTHLPCVQGLHHTTLVLQLAVLTVSRFSLLRCEVPGCSMVQEERNVRPLYSVDGEVLLCFFDGSDVGEVDFCVHLCW